MGQRDTVFVTGATGFLGSHVLHSLLESGYQVRALVRPGSRTLPPRDGCMPVVGDLTKPAALIGPMRGCRYLMHVAAVYSFAPTRRGEIWATNVRGTAGILEAAARAAIERAVVTSSSAAVGPARGNEPATERNYADADDGSSYHASKCRQERVALAARIPTVLVLPTAPIGPNDWKPTPTGKMIVDFMRGRIFASLGGGMNLVPVEDAAHAHVSALEQGRAGERYLVGGENLSLSRIWQLLADIGGRQAPTMRIPYSLALSLGWAEELHSRLFRRHDTGVADAPLIPLEGVRMARHNMFVSDRKAQVELGYRATAVQPALERAVRWYHDHGYTD